MRQADLRLTVDYETVPAARWLSSAPLLSEATQVALGKAIRREGAAEAMAAVPWIAGLHDAMPYEPMTVAAAARNRIERTPGVLRSRQIGTASGSQPCTIRSEPLPLVVLQTTLSWATANVLSRKQGPPRALGACVRRVLLRAGKRARPGRRALSVVREKTVMRLCAIDGGRMVAQCNFTNIVRGPFQACNWDSRSPRTERAAGHDWCVQAKRGGHVLGLRPASDRSQLHAAQRKEPARPRTLRLRPGGFARAYLQIAGQWEDQVLTALVNTRHGG